VRTKAYSQPWPRGNLQSGYRSSSHLRNIAVLIKDQSGGGATK
jgi:hypothetical protein